MAATQRNPDLIIMETHDSGLICLLLGSVADRLVVARIVSLLLTCPVAVTRKGLER